MSQDLPTDILNVRETKKVGLRDRVSRASWWVKPLILLPIYIVFFAIVAFFLVRMIPGDPIYAMMEGQVTEEQYAEIAAELGVNQPWYLALPEFLVGLVTGNWGTSIMTGRPVLADIADRLPATLELVLLATLVSLVIALLLSLIVALTRKTSLGSKIVRTIAASAGMFPDYVVGVVLIALLYSWIHLVPAPFGLVSPGQQLPDGPTGFNLIDAAIAGDTEIVGSILSHLILPVLVLALLQVPLILQQLIRGLDGAVESEFIAFRVVNGNSLPTVLASMYRNALPNVLVVTGTALRNAFGNAILVEVMFGLSGIGTYALQAVQQSDFFALRGFLVIAAIVSLVIFQIIVYYLVALVDRRRRVTN